MEGGLLSVLTSWLTQTGIGIASPPLVTLTRADLLYRVPHKPVLGSEPRPLWLGCLSRCAFALSVQYSNAVSFHSDLTCILLTGMWTSSSWRRYLTCLSCDCHAQLLFKPWYSSGLVLVERSAVARC